MKSRLSIVVLLACLNLGSILNAGFDQILVLYNPLVYSTGDILDTWVYRIGLIQSAKIVAGWMSVFGLGMVLSILLGFIEVFVATIFPSTLRDFIAYTLILLILVFRPHGFFGEAYSAQLRL